MNTQRPRISRRLLLGLAAGSLAGSACSPAPKPVRSNATEDLTAQQPFYVAFRAGARDWPELTGYAFEQAAGLPALQAVELSVCRTADGELVCSYDTDTRRLTGRSLTILDQPWSALRPLEVTSAETVNPLQPAGRYIRLDDVLAAHLDRFVFFVEPRTAEAESNLMAALIRANRPDRFVWKQPIVSRRFEQARSNGFATWGYVLKEPAHLGRNLKRLAASPDITMLGVSSKHPDALMRNVSTAARRHGKPAIAWNVFDGRGLRRALDLGFTGIATPHITKILGLAEAAEVQASGPR